MTDIPEEQPPSPGYIPGKPAIGYGMTPGMHHNVMTMKDDYAYPANPLDAPEVPEQASAAPAAAPQPPANPMNGFQAPPGKRIVGWRVRDANGDVVSELHNVNTSGDRTKKIDAVGRALYDQAISPSDKESAQRARAYGLSLVGIVPAEEITKRMLSFYENDQRNLTNRSIQEEKSKRAALRGGGGPAGMVPGGPTKGEHKLSGDLWNRVNGLVDSAKTSENYKALSTLGQSLDSMENAMNSGNAMSDRIAVQQLLRDLTGKASRESEQAAITGAAGKWEELKNKLSLWTSDDPQLSAGYKQQFLAMIASQRHAVQAAKDRLGREVAATVMAQLGEYPQEDRQQAADTAYGMFTGSTASSYKPPSERNTPSISKPAGAAPAAKPSDTPDLNF